MENIILSAENIGMRFSTRKGIITALKDLSFTVERGEFVAIVGPSGCGKSTLINILAGMLKPTDGQVLLEGKKVQSVNKKVGMVFQKYAAFPWMTVEQNVSYGPRIARLPSQQIKEITAKYIKMVGLEGYEHLYPKELSGGMSKRVDIARAYANSPDVLLMDEPFGALDDITKKQMQLELLKIWDQEKKTVLFITHDLEEALFLANKVIVLQRPDEDKNSLNMVQEIPFARPRLAELRADPEFIRMKTNLAEVMIK